MTHPTTTATEAAAMHRAQLRDMDISEICGYLWTLGWTLIRPERLRDRLPVGYPPYADEDEG